MTQTVPLWSSQSSVGKDTSTKCFITEWGVKPEESTGAVGTEGVGTSHNQGGEGFLGMAPQMASPLTCTIPGILLEGCQECHAFWLHQPPRVPCCSMQCLQSQTHLQPRLSLIRRRTDPPRLLQEPAFPGKLSQRPTQNSFVEASLGRATQPQAPQPARSTRASCHPGPLGERWQGTTSH